MKSDNTQTRDSEVKGLILPLQLALGERDVIQNNIRTKIQLSIEHILKVQNAEFNPTFKGKFI